MPMWLVLCVSTAIAAILSLGAACLVVVFLSIADDVEAIRKHLGAEDPE